MHDYTLSHLVRARRDTFEREAKAARLAAQVARRPSPARRLLTSFDAVVRLRSMRWVDHARRFFVS